MRVYFDSSVLISLYVSEVSSPVARALVERSNAPVLVNELQELEFRNGVRQKIMRKEVDDGIAAKCFRFFEDDLLIGRLEFKPVVWPAVYFKAERLSKRLAAKRVCRSVDLLHVAIAAASGVKRFATFDTAQAELAEASGMKLFES